MPPHHPASAEPPARIVLLRHGETEWSRTGRHTGVTDVALTERGEQRARAAAPLLAQRTVGLVLASPRQRAILTAALAGFDDQTRIEPDLAEFDYGAYEGLTSAEIAEQRPGWDLWRDGTPPGSTPGETAADVRVRVQRVIDRVLPVVEGGGDVLLVAHGHVLRALGAAWIGLPPEGGASLVLSTASLSELGFEHGNHVLESWNRVPKE